MNHTRENGSADNDSFEPTIGQVLAGSRAMHDLTPIVHINPQTTLKEAITLMQMYNYSQIPILKRDRRDRKTAKMLTWSTALNVLVSSPHDLDFPVDRLILPSATILEPFDTFRKAVEHVSNDEFVLLREDYVVNRILTSHDILNLYHEMFDPFLYIEPIEKKLLSLVDIVSKSGIDIKEAYKEKIDRDRAIFSSKKLDDFNLTLGEVIGILEQDNSWNALGLSLHKKRFFEIADRVLKIRNSIMHFREQDSQKKWSNISTLRSFYRMLQVIVQAKRGRAI